MDRRTVELSHEDFMDFAIGEFPYDPGHTATGEYHYLENEGYCGRWYDPVVSYTYNGSGASWIVTEEAGAHYMEQMRIMPKNINPMLITGDVLWANYTVNVRMRILNTKMGSAGMCLCCQNTLNTLAFVLENQTAKLVLRYKESSTVLKETPFAYSCDEFHLLTAYCDNDNVICCIDGQELFAVKCEQAVKGGKVGITATMPAQFELLTVLVSEEDSIKLNKLKDEYNRHSKETQQKYPEMKLYKKIDLKNFGTGRQVRFGHLLGDDRWQIVLGQCQKRVDRDAYAHISCVTAIDLDGNIIWQLGEPSTSYAHGKISADLPLQVYDIDDDGFDEVITARNGEILVLDGRSGAVKKRAKTPFSDDDNSTLIGVPYNTYAFERINPDGMRIANFSGKKRPSDILIKDRYCRVFALDNDLKVMWKFRSDKNTGHFPYAIDIDGDGKDELLCGYNMLNSDGTLRWTMPVEIDHIDEIVPGRFMAGDNALYFAVVAGTQGFMIVDTNGKIKVRDYIGHAQRVSVGNYCPDKAGFELCVTNFWGHQGVVYFYDSTGKPMWELENEKNGNVITPVNWKGDGSDLILLNAHPTAGGLIDGTGTRAVLFPDDGHPTMCAECIDIFGDTRDEIVVWDYHSMWIYTQADNPRKNVYKPVKYPHYNASNYRGEYSFPNDSYITP